jgi:hypothetical protein
MIEGLRFDGLSLTVDNVERALVFYRDKLKLEFVYAALPAFAFCERAQARSDFYRLPRRSRMARLQQAQSSDGASTSSRAGRSAWASLGGANRRTSRPRPPSDCRQQDYPGSRR